MTREARQFRCPERVLGWIPWYADGGLSAEQKGIVEAHAAECSDCRAELDIVAGAPFEIDMELPDPDRLFQEITARIDAGDRDAAARDHGRPSAANRPPVVPIGAARDLTDDELAKLEDWVFDPSTPESIALDAGADGVLPHADAAQRSPDAVLMRLPVRTWFAAAAALAILFAGGIGGALLSTYGLGATGSGDAADATYQSATASVPALATGASVGNPTPMLDVVFLETASVREVSDALQAVGVEIVSGPSSLGVYRVRLTRATGGPDQNPTAADVAAIASRLKAADSGVAIFAEAVP